MPSHSLNARTLVVCLGLTLAFAFPLFGSGQGETRLAPAERLIEQQDYSGALLMLAAIQRANPDLRDETSRLISLVIQVRGQEYNKVFGDLLQALFVDQDEDKAVKLIGQLQKIDPVRSTEEATYGTDFVRLLRLLNEASARMAAGRFTDALSLYLLPLADPVKAGFDMQKPHFESAGYGQIITANVHDAIAKVIAAGSQEVNSAAAIAAIPSAVDALLKQTATPETPAAFDALVEPLHNAARAETVVRGMGASLQTIARRIGETAGRGKTEPFLRYVSWLCLGRDKKSEGIAYAIQRLWEETAVSVAERASVSAENAFRAARAQYESGSLPAADASFTESTYRSIVAVKAAALAGEQIASAMAEGRTTTPERMKLLQAELARASAAQERAEEASAFHTLIGYRQELDRLPAVNPAAAVDSARVEQEMAQLSAARVALVARSRDARAQQDAWRAQASAWMQKSAAGPDLASLAKSAGGIADLFGAFVDTDIQHRDLAYAVRLVRLGGSGYAGRLDGAIALRKQAQDLKNGTKNGEVPSAQVLLEKHPELAIPLFQDAIGRFDGLIGDIGTLEQGLQTEKPYVTSSPALIALLKGGGGERGYDELLGIAREERKALDALVADAERQTEDAAVASREGDNQFTLAQNALKKSDPEAATSYLDRATDRYVESQSIAYTLHAVTRTDQDIPDLSKKIAALRNSLAIASAQKAVVAITARFNAKDYLGASDALDAAERNWSQTQAGTYPIFDNLRQNIQNALDTSAGREISRLDPKADVVNTFIKYAQDSLAAGRLQEAAANVKDALAVAPNYGTAKVLELMIKKQTDPAAFQRDASAQIAAYMKMATDSANPDRQKTAYNALLDYARLDPSFAALTRGAIQELEYALKLRRRPATSQQVADSNAFVQQANAVQQLGTAEGYQQALALLKQALQVNPDNAAAVRLDGEVRTKLGSTALASLSPADSQKYKKALSLYIAGAYQDSYDIVQELWNETPRNRTYDQLQKLKKRCEVALNIL